MPRQPKSPAVPRARGPRHGVARVLSKLGICSRAMAADWVRRGRIRLDGRVLRDPEHPVASDAVHRLRVDGRPARAAAPLYLALHKPRGVVTTARDERGRTTVYALLPPDLPWLAPVGRLDRASEGLLLMTNDTAWAAAVSAGNGGVAKHYDVQVAPAPAPEVLARFADGIVEGGERLAAEVSVLRAGTRRAWLRFVLCGGRNRQIRRMCSAEGLAVHRLLRVAIGGLALGTLRAGAWRVLSPAEVGSVGVAPAAGTAGPRAGAS